MLSIARFITFILHPIVLISPAIFVIIVGSGGSYNEALFWTLIALGFVGVVSSYILFGIKKGFFSNFDVSQRKQRIFLFPFIMGIGVLFLLLMYFLNGPQVLFFAIFYFVIAVLILALINLKIKASIHVGSITAAIVAFIYFFGYIFLPFLLIIPVMAWARIIEKRHTLQETFVGFIAGSVLALIGIIIVQYFYAIYV